MSLWTGCHIRQVTLLALSANPDAADVSRLVLVRMFSELFDS